MTVVRRHGAAALLALLAASLPWPAPADERSPGDGGVAGPLAVRNLSPVAQTFALPRALGPVLPPRAGALALHVEHANNFTANRDGETWAYLDGTTTVTTLSVRRGWGNRLEWGLEVPLVVHSGGATDGLIDGFHDLFGLPDGGRDGASRNVLDYRLVREGQTLARVDAAEQHLGDVRALLGVRLPDQPGRQSALRAAVELPTGRAGNLTGSDAVDVALWWETRDRRWLERLGVTVTIMGGVAFPGDGPLPGDMRRPVVFAGHLGLHYPLRPALSVHAQLDGHSDLADTPIPQLGDRALLGTLGATWRWPSSRWLALAVVEDLTTRSAPDVVFKLSMGSRF